MPRLALGPTQPPLQWVPGVEEVGHETDHSHPSSAEVKNAWSFMSTCQYVFMVWFLIKQCICLHGMIYLVKDWKNFTFAL
jgi:hypothetical protein